MYVSSLFTPNIIQIIQLKTSSSLQTRDFPYKLLFLRIDEVNIYDGAVTSSGILPVNNLSPCFSRSLSTFCVLYDGNVTKFSVCKKKNTVWLLQEEISQMSEAACGL